jgi:hypothetical protein
MRFSLHIFLASRTNFDSVEMDLHQHLFALFSQHLGSAYGCFFCYLGRDEVMKGGRVMALLVSLRIPC